MTTKFVAYYRVSTQRQGRSGLGLEAQQHAVKEYLRSKSGASLIGEFIEKESGKRTDRPQLALALSKARSMRATLIFAKLDRLARNAKFLLMLIDSGVDILFCDLPEIPAGAMGRFMLTQMAAVAELTAGQISENTKAALAAAKRRGVKLGGWRGNVPTHKAQLAGAKATAAKSKAWASDILPTIADIQATGATSLRAIAARLNERGVPTARGGEWQPMQVARILHNA